ncbi:helix-turn-helix domain-containing protein [Rhizobium sp. Leaf383]|uniref:helix-turn-helix domain-containing protein n=1 Tax=Rhizobium sp. Leaf383 TaxID=1736357 RepID=UPI000A6C6490|nr:helix-turn-helix domain-containing protein [Rhizobium sp. Leaf383]
MSLGKQIAAARKARQIRQHMVAEELGVTVQAVSQWERDKTLPSQLNLMRLSGLLGTEFDGVEALKHIPMFAKPATYAPIIDAYPSLFYGAGVQDIALGDMEGDFTDFTSAKTEMVPITWEPAGNVFAMRVKDKSMAPDFLPGDLVIADAGFEARPGDFVIAQGFPQGMGLLRKYRLVSVDDENRPVIDLVPLNADFPTTRIVVGDTGTITACVREYRRVLREK